MRIATILATLLLLGGCVIDRRDDSAPTREEIDRVLDDFHAAASAADGERYFGHFSDDAVFLGTDDTERWTVEEFRAYAHPFFAAGHGWTYVSSDRFVMFSADGRLAWFDEKLDNDKYGRTRGSGVLKRTADGWKIAHYNLSFTIPNDLAADAVSLIRAGSAQSE